MEDPRIISTQFNSPKMPYYNVLVNTKGNREWSFRTDKAILYQMMDMPIVRIRSLDLKKNPFLDGEYFEHRRKQHKKDKETAYLSSTAALSGYYAL